MPSTLGCKSACCCAVTLKVTLDGAGDTVASSGTETGRALPWPTSDVGGDANGRPSIDPPRECPLGVGVPWLSFFLKIFPKIFLAPAPGVGVVRLLRVVGMLAPMDGFGVDGLPSGGCGVWDPTDEREMAELDGVRRRS